MIGTALTARERRLIRSHVEGKMMLKFRPVNCDTKV